MDVSCTEDNVRHYYWERLAEEYKESLCTIFAIFCDSIISKQKVLKCMDIYSVPRTEEHTQCRDTILVLRAGQEGDQYINKCLKADWITRYKGLCVEAGEIKLEESERPFQRRQNLS